MKFTKSLDGKRRADLVIKVRIGYSELYAAVCAMLAHNQLMELITLYKVETIARVPRKAEDKKRITRMSVMEYLRQQLRIGCDIGDIGDDYEADASSITQLLLEQTNPEEDFSPDQRAIESAIESKGRKLVKELYPELKKADR